MQVLREIVKAGKFPAFLKMICKVWVRVRGELSPARYYRYADFLRRRKYSRCEISILRNGWDVCLTAGICIAMRLASMMLGASMANVISTERPFPACPRGQVIAKYFIVMTFISFEFLHFYYNRNDRICQVKRL